MSVLTLMRPKSAVPFGGMYRVIDFALSNLMNSGVERVGILSQYRSYSLMNHIGIGAWWDFVGRHRCASLLPPSTGYKDSDWYKGTADAVYQNLDFIAEHNPKYVLILSGDHIYHMNYQQLLNFHMDKQADLTVAFLPISPETCSRFGVAEIDDEGDDRGGQILQYIEKPPKSDLHWASMTIYLFNTAVLLEVLEENARETSHEFGRDIIPKMLQNYRVYGYKFFEYWGYARTIDEYWQTNMDLLGNLPKIDLEQWQLRTNLDHNRLRDRPPAYIAEGAIIEDSFVHNGCRIDGEVHHSILFAGVKVEKGAQVRDSILLFDTVVKSGSILNKVITDIEVSIGSRCYIGYGEEITPNRDHPELLNSGITIVGLQTSVPEGTQIGRNCIVYPYLKEINFPQKTFESGVTIK